MKNIDFECARASEKIRQKIEVLPDKDVETEITKALGVLQEEGLYAFFLYIKAKNKNVYDAIGLENEAKELFRNILSSPLDTSKKGFELAREISTDLDKLLLAKEVLERTLVYARYHAKTFGEKKNEMASI